MNTRRALLIVGIIALLGVIGTGVYFLLLAPKSTPTPAPTGTTGSLPATGNQATTPKPTTTPQTTITSSTSPAIGKNFGIISDEAVLDYFVNAGNIVTAIEPDGKIVQVVDGKANSINALQIQNILTAKFSYNGAKILVHFGDAANPQTSVFDIATKAWIPMPAGWHSPVWSPVDYRVAYHTDSAAGIATFSTMDASKPKGAATAIFSLHAQDLALAWPTAGQLVISTKPDASVAGSIFLYNLTQRTLTPVVSESFGVTTAWNAKVTSTTIPAALRFSGNRNGAGGVLDLITASGNNLQTLKFVTLPSKCSFQMETSTEAIAPVATPTATTSTIKKTPVVVAPIKTNSYLYCGVPRDQQGLAFKSLPNSYDQMALFTSDDLYRIDLQSGAIDPVFNDQTQDIDASSIKIFNHRMFFVNRYNQKLYTISL